MNAVAWTPELLRELAVAAHKSGLAPSELRSPEACFYVMCAGQELGLQPIVSLRTLSIVKGKISIGAEVMLGMIQRAGVRHEWLQADEKGAVLRLTREGYEPYTSSFSMQDAQRAGLTGSQTWKNYPGAMCRARCISAAVRAYCPDVITGCYTPEEVASFAAVEDTTDVRVIPGPTSAPTPLALADNGPPETFEATTQAPELVERDEPAPSVVVASTPEPERTPEPHRAAPGAEAKAAWLDKVGILRFFEDHFGIARGWEPEDLAEVDRVIGRIAEKLPAAMRRADNRPTKLWTDDATTRRAVYRVAENVLAAETRERDDADAARKAAELAAWEATHAPATDAVTEDDGMPR